MTMFIHWKMDSELFGTSQSSTLCQKKSRAELSFSETAFSKNTQWSSLLCSLLLAQYSFHGSFCLQRSNTLATFRKVSLRERSTCSFGLPIAIICWLCPFRFISWTTQNAMKPTPSSFWGTNNASSQLIVAVSNPILWLLGTLLTTLSFTNFSCLRTI